MDIILIIDFQAKSEDFLFIFKLFIINSYIIILFRSEAW
jgi:hypothetical protein